MGERYAASEVEHCVSRDLTQNAEWFNSANLQDDDVDDEPETSYLQEHVMRDFLERNPDAKVKPRKKGINDITWNDIPEMDLPGFSLRKLLSDPTAGWTFATSTGLPPPCRAAPHEIELVPGAKPFRMPRPKYKPAREAYLNMWDKEMFRQGAHEPSTSAGATSTVEVPKPPNVKDVRVCINLAMPNQRFVKRVPQTRDLRSETRKLSGMTMFFSTDGHNAFGQVILAKHSRKHCAYWTPSGLRQPTRMVFGDTNAPTKWQGFVDESCAGLSEKAKKHLANYVDDFLIGVTGSTLREAAENLYVCVKEFLEMCKENGITLSPHKTFIGFATAKFGGRTVGQGKTCVTEDALKPIREMQHPTDKASLRRTLGMFVQSKDFIPSYSMLAKPLTRLTGKVPWQWTDTEQEAFGNMRSAVLKYTKLHTPDYSRPIYIRVDASDEGEGGYLFQLEKPYDDEELKDIDPKHVQVIKYFSKAYGPTMRKMPIYYREAHAAIFRMKKCEDILMRAHIPTVVISDYAPFQWVLRTVTRTVVTRWIVENICALQWRVVYVAGEKNVVPDALSRFPVIARGHFLTTGLESAVDHLLSAVDARWKEAKTIWVWARKDTTSMARKVQAWRNPKNAVLTGAPKRILEESEPFDVAVVVPEAERAPEYCKKLFLKKKPFACLIPSDLVFWIPRDSKDREVLYQDVVDALEKASKITYLDAGLTWIVSGTEFPDEVMFEQTDDSLGEKFDDKLIARTGGEVGTDPLVLQAWVKAQKAEIDDIKKYYGEQVAKLSSGLKIVVDRQSGLSRIYVPRCFREQVAQKVHESTSHGGWKRVELALKKKYIWPSMQSYLKSYVRSCVHCVLAKSKLNWAHGRFKAVEYKLPCRAYALDFYSIGEAEDGHIGVLTMVDLCSRWTMFEPVLNMTGKTTVAAITRRIVGPRGPFKVLVSDAARAFLGKVLTAFKTNLDADHIVTYCYPKGNSVAERVHVVLGEFLRLLPKSLRKRWNHEIYKLQLAVNTTVNANTGLSPYEIERGMEAPSVLDMKLTAVPKVLALNEFEDGGARIHADVLKSTAIFREAAYRHSCAARMSANAKLNEKCFRRVDYKVGDPVVVHVIPGNESDDWKKKHQIHWRLATVVRKVSDSVYEVKDLTGHIFQRSVALLAPDVSRKKDAAKSEFTAKKQKKDLAKSEFTDGKLADGEITDKFLVQGDFYAVLDHEENGIIWIAKYEGMENELLKFRCYGTTGKNLRTAKFSPIFQERGSSKIILHKPRRWEKDAVILNYVVDIDFVVRRVRLKKSNQISKADYDALERLGLRHKPYE